MHRKKLWLLMCMAVAIFVAVSQVLVVYADPGDLDTTFSVDGMQTTDFFVDSDGAQGVAIQADGKIVAAGFASNGANDLDFALARYNSNGTLDGNFDADGRVTTDFQNDSDQIVGIAIQPDGKIVVAGAVVTASGEQDVAVARYNTDGSPDTSFSGNGRVTTDIRGDDAALAVTLQADGKIVVAGFSYITAPESANFALVRYNSNGTLDVTFDGDGVVLTDFNNDEDAAFDVVLQADNKILAAGMVGTAGSHDFGVARYNTNGSLDTTFSVDGKTSVDFSSDEDAATDLVVLPDGKIVLAGQALFTDFNFGLARFLPDGTLDNSFSGNGRANTDFGDDETAFEILLQPDGKLVAVGSSGPIYFALARYNPNGTLDTSFSGDGKVQHTFLGGAFAGALQSDNKIVAVGAGLEVPLGGSGSSKALIARMLDGGKESNKAEAPSGGPPDFAIARYENDPPPPTPTATRTATRTSTTTRTPTTVNSPTHTHTPTRTSTPTRTNTPPPTQTPGGPTATHTSTPPSTPTHTSSPTNVPPGTATPTACLIQFADVPANNTFYPFTRCLACRGIDTGFPCGGAGEPCNPQNEPYFRINTLIKRDDLAHMVAASAGFDEDPGTRRFEDVPPSNPYYVWVQRMANRGLISGYPCGGPGEPCVPPGNLAYYRPNANATRGQIAKIVSNGAGFSEPPVGQLFEDVPPTQTFYEWIQRLANRDVMGGYPCGGAGEPCVPPENRPYFRWYNDATRGQVAKIVANTFFPGCNPR
jgi:uncharacterized delta-60 repeat protein